MLQLIGRCPEYAEEYKAYCQEYYDHNVVFSVLFELKKWGDELKCYMLAHQMLAKRVADGV